MGYRPGPHSPHACVRALARLKRNQIASVRGEGRNRLCSWRETKPPLSVPDIAARPGLGRGESGGAPSSAGDGIPIPRGAGPPSGGARGPGPGVPSRVRVQIAAASSTAAAAAACETAWAGGSRRDTGAPWPRSAGIMPVSSAPAATVSSHPFTA